MVISCGLLMYVRAQAGPKVLLVRPGGPFWRGKDKGAWSIPKGIADDGEELLAAAQREFTEETGIIAQSPFLPLTPLKQKGGKTIHCWAFEGQDPFRTRRLNRVSGAHNRGFKLRKGPARIKSPRRDRAAAKPDFGACRIMHAIPNMRLTRFARDWADRIQVAPEEAAAPAPSRIPIARLILLSAHRLHNDLGLFADGGRR